jgi:hypothetical protein
VTKPCPICAEWQYISIVKVCPICGAPGKLQEVEDTAEEFLRLWETGTFEQIWDVIIPLPYCRERPLTKTEMLLLRVCDDERQAIALAKHITLPENATAEQIEAVVTLALVRAKEAASGPADVEYVSGQRRDTLRT